MHGGGTSLEVCGTQQQSISSCLQVLDRLLKERDVAVVGSMIMAERKSTSRRADNIVESVANIIGVRDIKTINMHATLPELGMDSLLVTEIKEVLKKEFEIVFTMKELRNLTFARLHDIMLSKAAEELEGYKLQKTLEFARI